MKNYKILLLLVIVSLNLFAQETKKVSVQLLWKHQFEFAGFYMAKEKGFYKDLGLDVELKEYQFGTDITKDVQSGKSTFGVGYPSIILDKINGANIVFLNAILQSSPHVFISLKSSGINSIQDFKNKKIMIDKDAIKSTSLLSLLYSNHIYKKDITLVQPSWNIEDLINDKVDVFSAYLSNEIYKLDKLKIPYTIFNPKDCGFDFYNDILFTSEKLAKNDPKLIQNFQNATLRGWRYAFNHRDETINIIIQKYNTQNKTKEALQYEAKILENLAYTNGTKLGDIKLEKIQRILDIYNLIGLVQKNIHLKNMIYNHQSNVNLTNEEKKWIKNNRIKVGISPWYPITYYDTKINKFGGVAYDIFDAIAKKLQLNIEYIPNKWSVLLNDFKNHHIDILPTTFYTKQRSTFGHFSKPYLDIKEQLYVRKASNIHGFNDLKGKRIAIVKAYGGISKIKEKYPSIQIIQTDTLKQSIEMVLTNQADATFNSQFNVSSFLKNNFIYNLKPVYQSDFEASNLHFFTQKDNKILQNILEKGLNHLSYEEKNTIISKWIDTKENKVKITNKKLDFLTKKDREYLKRKKEITMCIDPSWMPFESFKDGKYIGMSADYFKIFSQDFKLPIKVIKTKTWTQSLEFAKSRKCDILSLAMKTPSRSKYLNFTTSYLKIPLVLATKNDVPFIANFQTLKTQKIGIPKGYAFIELLRNKYPNINIIEVKNITAGLQKVANGELFGYIGTLASVGYMFQKEFIGELKIAGKFNENWELGIGVRNDDPTLLNILEASVENIPEVVHRNILNKWIAIKYDKGVDYTIIWQLLAVISIVIILILYRHMILKKANKNLQKIIDNKTKELMDLNKNLKKKVEQAIL